MSDATTRAIELAKREADWNAVLRALRAEGFSKTDCVGATYEVLNRPLAEAKRVVHFSDVWADVRDCDEALHDRVIEGVEALIEDSAE